MDGTAAKEAYEEACKAAWREYKRAIACGDGPATAWYTLAETIDAAWLTFRKAIDDADDEAAE